jgi:hypothetical protein
MELHNKINSQVVCDTSHKGKKPIAPALAGIGGQTCRMLCGMHGREDVKSGYEKRSTKYRRIFI